MKFSIQLWSVKDALSQDFFGTLKLLKGFGYEGVEFAGFYDIPKEKMSVQLKEIGLYAASSHCGVELFKDRLSETLEYNKAIGSEYMVCPGADLSTIEKIDDFANMLNNASKEAKKVGIKIGYHNHFQEFDKINDNYILDILAEKVEKDIILELDVFWLKYSKVNPYEYIKKHGDRVELIHLKQIGIDNNNFCLSDGIIDIKKVIKTSKYAKHFIIEQERFDGMTELDAAKKNIEFLKSL